MKNFHIFIIIILLYIFSSKDIEIEKKLDGIPISSDFNSEKIHFAFDGDLSTNFQSSEEYGWIGKELKYPSNCVNRFSRFCTFTSNSSLDI